MRGRSAGPIALGPEPTTFIFATVADESRGLKIQKIQVRKLGTLTKNFFACGRSARRVLELVGREQEDAPETRGSGPGIYWTPRMLRS